MLALCVVHCGSDSESAVCVDGSACDDGDPCTVRDQCIASECLGEAKDCSGVANSCSEGVCQPEDGVCVALALADELPCEDADRCTVNERCLNGLCQGEALDCSALDAGCLYGVCDEQSGACAAGVLPDGADCDDADHCTILDRCDVGACAGQTKDCSSFDTGCGIGYCQPETGDCDFDAFPEGTACEDGDPCTVGEMCRFSTCGGGAVQDDGSPCEDGDRCTIDTLCAAGECVGTQKDCPASSPCEPGVCDADSGECTVGALANGSLCDDGDPCTEGQTCDGLVCGGGESVCFCLGQVDDTPCDDSNPCTVGDTCQAETCVGAPKDCSAYDAVCEVGACEVATGLCGSTLASLNTPCDDGDACTVADMCKDSECLGAPLDCSAFGDDVCMTGQCDLGTGSCVSMNKAEGHPCDDGEVCTGDDRCTAGLCEGSVALCDLCNELELGAPCDDGNPCTAPGQCGVTDGVYVCQTAQLDCSSLDSACLVGLCWPESGECVTAPRPNGSVCDDDQPCTQNETCYEGSCVAEPIPMCGASIDTCAHPATSPESIELVDGEHRVMAQFSAGHDVHWYHLPLDAGDLLTVTMGPHCDSQLVATLGLYPFEGTLPLVTASGALSEAGLVWPNLAQIATADDGLYAVKVQLIGESAAPYQLLFSRVSGGSVCDEDGCGCAELVCVEDGPQLGLCLPAVGVEQEPNEQPADATLLEDQLVGELSSFGDEDWYRVSLTAGVATTLRVWPFCDDVVDPQLSVYNALGEPVIADSDSAGLGYPMITGWMPTATGQYTLRVRDEGVTTGRYRVSLGHDSCQASDCDCVDQSCDLATGLCVPLVSAPELPDDQAAILPLDTRTHGELSPPFDQDLYEITLEAGTWDFITAGFCGAPTDTKLSVLTPDGAILVSDDDSGEGLAAAIEAWVLPEATTVRLRITGHGASTGPYIVTVRASGQP